MELKDLDSRVRWIEYNGKRILRIDLSKLKGPEGIQVLDREAAVFKKEKSKIRRIVDLTDGFANTEFMNYAKKMGKDVFIPQLEKGAMFGAKGVQLILLQAYHTFTGALKFSKHFATEKEGLDWLVS